MQAEMAAIEASIPPTWEAARARYVELASVRTKARREYRRSVDDAYRTVAELRVLIADAKALRGLEPTLSSLAPAVANDPPEQAMEVIKAAERELGEVAGGGEVRGKAVQGPPGPARQTTGSREGRGVPGRSARALRG